MPGMCPPVPALPDDVPPRGDPDAFLPFPYRPRPGVRRELLAGAGPGRRGDPVRPSAWWPFPLRLGVRSLGGEPRRVRPGLGRGPEGRLLLRPVRRRDTDRLMRIAGQSAYKGLPFWAFGLLNR